jgi:hypothetical protein
MQIPFKLRLFEDAEKYFRPKKKFLIKYGYRSWDQCLCNYFFENTHLTNEQIKTHLAPLWIPYRNTKAGTTAYHFTSGKKRYKAIKKVIKQLEKELYGR